MKQSLHPSTKGQSSIITTPKRYNLRSHTKGTNFRHLATQQLLAQHIFPHNYVHHIYDNTGRRIRVLDLLQGNESKTWQKSMSMELGRLAQGNKYGVTPTDTIDFIMKHEVPINKRSHTLIS